jgi:hypothetical protein
MNITYESFIGKHCYFVHDPEKRVQRIWATQRQDGKPRFHLWIHTQDPNGPQKCDWLAQMPATTNWIIRNYQQSEERLTSAVQAADLGRRHAGLHAAMLQDAVRQGISTRRIWFTGRNEPQPEEMAYLNAYEIARMDRATELGQATFSDPKAIQVVLWNIPEGNPGTFGSNPQAACDWDVLLPSRARALQLSPDGDQRILYGYHAYFGWPGPNEFWGGDDMKLYAIPYRISHLAWPEKKWMFTEGGCDQGVNQDQGKNSWRSVPVEILQGYGLPDSEDGRAELYSRHLIWLDKIFALDGRILGQVLFTDDWDNNQWWKFDTNVLALDARLTPYVTRTQTLTVWGDLSVARWQPLIEHRAAQHQLDPHVVAVIIKLESNGRVDALSATGDTGLMQVIDGEHLAGRPIHTVLLNPDQNVKTGCAILASSIAAFPNNLAAGIAAYNCGVAAIQQYGITGPLAQKYLTAFRTAWAQLWPTLTCPISETVVVPPPVEPPPPPVEPPPVVDNIVEQVRNAAWNHTGSGVAYNPTSAFVKYAKANNLGHPVTNEFDVNGYRGQGFNSAVIYAKIDDYNNIQVASWFNS